MIDAAKYSQILSHMTGEGVVICIAVIFKQQNPETNRIAAFSFAEDNHKASLHCYFKYIRGAFFPFNKMYIRSSWNLDYTPFNVYH